MRKKYNIFHEVRAVKGVLYLWKSWGVSSLRAMLAEACSFAHCLVSALLKMDTRASYAKENSGSQWPSSLP